MRAAVIDRFGGPEELHVVKIPIPAVGPKEVLVKVDGAGVGAWDPWLREGGASGQPFPIVLGSDGAGSVAAVGESVKRFDVGSRVYGYAYNSPKGGFYAEYAVLPEDNLAIVPGNVGKDEACALAVSGLTGLIGLEKLRLKEDQTLIIVGASGGVGHVALQLAKLMGARVLGVASGKDGVELVNKLGADAAVERNDADLIAKVKDFAPEGVDAILAFAYSKNLDGAFKRVKRTGRIAFPNGVEPEPPGANGVQAASYDGLPGKPIYQRLNDLIAKGEFRVEVSKSYPLEDAAQAHHDILKHHVGKLVLRTR
ncbi:MAG: NADP-dependent oxidoreductase [Methanomassiliicoccales archaeon]|nr:NADP-dependent oxidoreductase [Methanomassiliicoccales archaeon]